VLEIKPSPDTAYEIFTPLLSRRTICLRPTPFRDTVPSCVPDDGAGWGVEAHINRPKEKIGHFGTYSKARSWNVLESAPYFVLREIKILSGASTSGVAG
jgi:hypothetical protein